MLFLVNFSLLHEPVSAQLRILWALSLCISGAPSAVSHFSVFDSTNVLLLAFLKSRFYGLHRDHMGFLSLHDLEILRLEVGGWCIYFIVLCCVFSNI
jgi:hypothetical protein